MLRNDLRSSTPLNSDGCLLQSLQLGRRQSSGTALGLPCLLQNVLQCKDIFFRNEPSHFAVGESLVTVTVRSVDQRLELHVNFESKAGDAALGPTCEGRFADSANNLCSLPHVVEAISLVVEDGLEIGHSERQRHSKPEFKDDLSRPLTIGEWWDEQDEW